MSTTLPRTPSVVVNVSVPEFIDTLRGAFGSSFDCWRRDGRHWLRQSRTTNISDSLIDSLDLTISKPNFIESAAKAILAVPFVDEQGEDCVAIGCVRTREPALAKSLAETLVRELQQRGEIDQLELQVDACNVQISADFEDLAFLRQLAEHLDLAGVSVSLSQFAETILPLLRRSVRAEALLLVADSSDGVYPRLIRTFGRADREPVIVNDVQSRPDSGEFPGIESLMLVRVAKDDDLFGWLLAINRRQEPSSGDDRFVSEFGTVEAGLVSNTASMLATHAQNVELYREKEDVLVSLVRSLVNAIEAKDPYTCGHSERVAMFAERLAHAIGLDADDCKRIYFTGLLHDVGKIGVSETTLMKPGRLTAEEFAEIQNHPDLGWQILQDSAHLKNIFPGVVHHHERVDGAGYPDGLAGEAIPLDARILAVADAYDAMTSDRPYRRGLSQEKAEAILREEAGSQWDTELISSFLQIMTDIVELRTNYRRPAVPLREPLTKESDG